MYITKESIRSYFPDSFQVAGFYIGTIPLAAGVQYAWSVILTPAVGTILMSLSTVIMAVNARFLKMDS